MLLALSLLKKKKKKISIKSHSVICFLRERQLLAMWLPKLVFIYKGSVIAAHGFTYWSAVAFGGFLQDQRNFPELLFRQV